jgi:guanylate kinase
MSSSKEKHEKLIILGGTGSGKNYIFGKLVEIGLIGCIKTTTQPKRINEVHSFKYNYVTDCIFKDKINNGELLCYHIVESNTEVYYYGITNEEFERAQVFIISPNEFKFIDKETRKNCFVVYLDIDREIREGRIKNKIESTIKILDAEEEDFKDFSDYDLKVKDSDFEAKDIYDLMY